MMSKRLGVAAAAAFLAFATTGNAATAEIDFTADTGVTGFTSSGVFWKLTGVPNVPNDNQLYDGKDGIDGIDGDTFGLAFKTDGFGIAVGGDKDDEIGPAESITITFATAVQIIGFAFLDLFAIGSADGESGIMTIGTQIFTVKYNSANATPGGGFAQLLLDSPITTTTATFTAGRVNDARGVADGALAAVFLAPVPAPAAGLLLLTAVGGFAALRRRKAARAL